MRFFVTSDKKLDGKGNVLVKQWSWLNDELVSKELVKNRKNELPEQTKFGLFGELIFRKK